VGEYIDHPSYGLTINEVNQIHSLDAKWTGEENNGKPTPQKNRLAPGCSFQVHSSPFKSKRLIRKIRQHVMFKISIHLILELFATG
jgi:hypothetical protein